MLSCSRRSRRSRRSHPSPFRKTLPSSQPQLQIPRADTACASCIVDISQLTPDTSSSCASPTRRKASSPATAEAANQDRPASSRSPSFPQLPRRRVSTSPLDRVWWWILACSLVQLASPHLATSDREKTAPARKVILL